MNRDEMDALGERALQAINRATQEGKSETVELGRFIFEECAAWSRRVTPDAGVREALVEAQKYLQEEAVWSECSDLSRIIRVRDLVDAALASTPPQVKTDAGAWRTMESAPRDGTDFLSCGGEQGNPQTAYPTRWLSPGPYSTENGKNAEGQRRYQWPDGFYWAGYDGFVGPITPTHWQPLPTPPQVLP